MRRRGVALGLLDGEEQDDPEVALGDERGQGVEQQAGQRLAASETGEGDLVGDVVEVGVVDRRRLVEPLVLERRCVLSDVAADDGRHPAAGPHPRQGSTIGVPGAGQRQQLHADVEGEGVEVLARQVVRVHAAGDAGDAPPHGVAELVVQLERRRPVPF